MNTNYQEYIPDEQSYIENILRNNIGKKVKAYVSFSDSNEWKDKIFEGIIEEIHIMKIKYESDLYVDLLKKKCAL
mgnify:CR=1 FL=1